MSLEEKAQEHEAKVWLQQQQLRVVPPMYQPQDAGYGPAECVRCDAPMPALRRQNGWRLCTACQTKAERRQ